MSAQQFEALRLAGSNEASAHGYLAASVGYQPHMDTSAEIRRLHAENEALKSELRMEQAISFRRQMQEYAVQRDELLEALKWTMTMTMDADQDTDGWERVHSAIAKATGEQS